MKTIFRKLILGMILTQSLLSVAQASLLPMTEKISFARVALYDQLQSQGLQLVKVDIKDIPAQPSLLSGFLDRVTALYATTDTVLREHVRFKARDLSTEQVYVGWVYLQTQDVTAYSDDEIAAESTAAGPSPSYNRVVETSGRKKLWMFLTDSSSKSGPMPRFGDGDLHLVQAD